MLQCAIELGVEGLRLCDYGIHRTTEQVLSALFRRRALWHGLRRLPNPIQRTIPTGREPKSYLVHGVFASSFWQGVPHDSNLKFVALTVPDFHDDPAEPLLSGTPIVHGEYAVFSLDPSQNLLVFVFVEGVDDGPIYVSAAFRDLATGNRHGHAYAATLSSPIRSRPFSTRVETAGDVVAAFLFLLPGQVTIVIWNWRSGQLLVVSETSFASL